MATTTFCTALPCFPAPVVKDIVTDPSEEFPIEINYDTNELTYLYQAIEDKAFMAAIDFLESNQPQVYDECRTWVTRYELKNPKKIRWSHLPLHAALVFKAPPRLIELLVKQYPKGVRCTDDQSMLPLHLAFRFGAVDATIWALVKEFPEAINAKDNKGRYPLQMAAQGESWKKGEIIATFENSAKLRVKKQSTGERIEEMETSLAVANELNEQLQEQNGTLRKEKEDLVIDLENAKKQITILKALAVVETEDKKSKKLVEAAVEATEPSTTPKKKKGFWRSNKKVEEEMESTDTSSKKKRGIRGLFSRKTKTKKTEDETATAEPPADTKDQNLESEDDEQQQQPVVEDARDETEEEEQEHHPVVERPPSMEVEVVEEI
jgi:hypothetical protein